MMNLYLIFCASIYRFYVRKNDKLPEAITFWLTTTILTANFFAVYDFIRYYWITRLPFNLILVFIFFGTISFVNYFAIFFKALYKEKTPSSLFNRGVVFYIIISIIVVIYIGSLHRERNLNVIHKQNMEQTQ